MHILLWSYLGAGSSKLVVLKSASTVNSNKFWLHNYEIEHTGYKKRSGS